MATALIALGSNLGDRQSNIEQALKMLAERAGVRLIAMSTLLATRPIGGPAAQGEFLNAAALCETSLDPHELFAALQEIERSLGRQRECPRWAARPIDLDLLLFDQQSIDSPNLTVPHPRMAYRRFVIEPSAEIASQMRHPTIGWTLAELRDHLRHAAPYIAIAGAPAAGKTELAHTVASHFRGLILSDPAAAALTGCNRLVAGPTIESEIEFLRLRTSQLARAWKPESSASEASEVANEGDRDLGLSDYWLEQSFCYAAETLAPKEFDQYCDQWRATAAQLPMPKLLVLLDAPDDFLWSRFESRKKRPAWMNRERFQRVHAAIVDRVVRSNRGPVLVVDSGRPTDARIELSAAVEAMRHG